MGKPVKHAALNSIWSLIFAVLLSVALVACGGHGGGGGDGLNSNNNGNNNSGASAEDTVKDAISVAGQGSTSSDESLELNVISDSWLSYSNAGDVKDFQSTSISGLSVSGDTATITGERTLTKLNDQVLSGCAFTAAVKDNIGTPDEIGIEIHCTGFDYMQTSLSVIGNGNNFFISNRIH